MKETSGFDKRKNNTLHELDLNINENRKDKSKQGFLDDEIIDLVKTINSTRDYYTTSSCAGRILVMFKPNNQKKLNKAETIWIYKSHKISNFEDILQELDKFIETNNTEKKCGIISFKQEPMILHIEARDLDSAHNMIVLAGETGFKKKSIIGIRKRIILEISSSNIIEFPIGENSEIKCNMEHLRWILEMANKNIIRNKKMIDRFDEKIRIL